MNKISQFLHRLKNRIERFAQKPFASSVLLLLAFIESSLLPIAPDFLFIPLSVTRPKRSLFYAVVCVVGSTCGAILGYFIGYQLFEIVGAKVLNFFGWTELFQIVLNKYRENAWSTLIFAGFTPIPFQVFTYAAGFKQTIALGAFIPATLAGRSLRFFLVGVLLLVFGPKVKELLDRYLERATIVIILLILVWFLVVKILF